ncbi:MAG: polyphenol oxidase family protein [Deltaproteobacteria bacterium]|nr:polyphenol oxidase family protein [Deltaproteobacteria bacterium]
MLKLTDGLERHAFELFADHPRLRHGLFARGPDGRPASFSFGAGQDDRTVMANFRAAERCLGLPPSSMVGQVHGDRVLTLAAGEIYRPDGPEQVRGGYDAIIGRPGQTLAVRLADCQGILLFEPASLTTALVHSGWRGSVKNVLGRTVAALRDELGLNPADLLAAVSPSLGPCCAQYRDWAQDFPPEFGQFRPFGDDRFDFQALSLSQLTAAGLRPQNIQLSGVCTRCSPDFFSHRRGDVQRFALLAGAPA